MTMHRGCITDPLAKAWWRDYRALCAKGNPQGLSFVEFVAARADALGPTLGGVGPWYVATCGHQHPWGASCASEMVV